MLTGVASIEPGLRQHMSEHWRLYLAEGVLLSFLGVGATIVPPVAGLATTIVIGWLLTFAGCIGAATSIGAWREAGSGWSLTSALVSLAAGGILLWNPVQGVITLTYVMVAFFIIDGIITLLIARSFRQQHSARSGWMVANGLLDFLLAAVVLTGLPETLTWALGVMVGIDLLFAGASLIAVVLTERGRRPTTS